MVFFPTADSVHVGNFTASDYLQEMCCNSVKYEGTAVHDAERMVWKKLYHMYVKVSTVSGSEWTARRCQNRV